MEIPLSGSFVMAALTDEDIDESLELLMDDSQFEQDLINSFNEQMYVVKDTAPNPIWTLCSITMRMVRILPQTEVVPLDELGFGFEADESLIECLVGTNLVKIQKKYVAQGEWH